MGKRSSVLVVVELEEDNRILPISLECLRVGRKLAEPSKGELIATIVGRNVQGPAEELRHYGVDTIVTVEDQLLEAYHPDSFVVALERVIEEVSPESIVMGCTLTSIDLAPRVAFKLDVGLITDCVGIEFDSGEALFHKPVYSGNIMAVYSLASKPYMVTMRSRAVEPPERSDVAKGKVIPLDVVMDASTIKTPVLKRELELGEGPRLQSADIVVAGGRGIGGKEGFDQLSDLAKVLGAAVGASRPPCDIGWVHSNAQVGQTGEIVAPSIYIAIGISGSTQHIAGMSAAKVIVAINKDAGVNIFKIADYGIVGKYEEVLPSFKEALHELLK